MQKLFRYPKRNNYLLTDTSRNAEKGKVNLNYWKISGKEDNVGDYLSLVIFEYMKKYYGIESDDIGKTVHFCGVGSLFQLCDGDAVFWGSGLYLPEAKWKLKIKKHFLKWDIRAVRGPLTAKSLTEAGFRVPDVMGDPAVLMPLIYQPETVPEKKYEYKIIRHWSMVNGERDSMEISPITSDYKGFINSILECKKIVSSSLHGVILAEAYGVPAVLFQPHENNDYLFKYSDYYYSTGRFEFPVAKSAEEALEMTPPPLPDLTSMRENLIKAFPKDIWGK